MMKIVTLARRTARLLLVVIGLVAILPWLGHGIDLTDEGYYLNSVRHPSFDVSFSIWPVVARPFWEVSFGHLGVYRMINLALTLAFGVVLARSILVTTSDAATKMISSALGLCTLVGLRVWLPTMNYNWLNIQGLLLLWLGVFITRDRVRGFVVTVGLAFVLSAKPTTALLVFPLFVLGLFGSRDKKRALQGVGFAIIPLLGVHLMSRVSPIALFTEMRFISDSIRLLNGDSFTVVRLNWATWRAQINANLPSLAISAGVGLCLCLLPLWRNKYVTSVTLVGAALLASTFFIMDAGEPGLNLVFVCGAFLVFSAVFRLASFKKRTSVTGEEGQLPEPKVLIAFAMFATPYAFAFGTNTDYFFKMQDAFVFVILGTAYLARKSRPVLWALACMSVIFTAVNVGEGIAKPYRQNTAIPFQALPIETADQFKLKVGSDTARYMTEISSLLAAGGYHSGDPVLDMSGRNPGVVWLVGAEPIGGTWVIGGYPGSNELLRLRLSRTRCRTIASSWVLREDGIYSELSVAEIFGSEDTFRRLFYRVGATNSIPVNGVVPTPTKLSVWSPRFNFEEAKSLPCRLSTPNQE